MPESISIILSIIHSFEKRFSRRTAFLMFARFILGFLLFTGRKTVTGVCRFARSGGHISNYYKFLSRSPWKALDVSRALFEYILEKIFPLQARQDRLIVVVDSTHIEKSGKKMDGFGRYFSSIRSAALPGHEVVRLSILVDIPDIGKLEFPFMSKLYVKKDAIEKRNLDVEYRTREEMAPFLVNVVSQWTRLPILVLGDALYSSETTVNPLRKSGVHIVSRRRNSDKHGAVAIEAADVKTGKRGRPKKYGDKIRFNEIPLDRLSPCEYLHGSCKKIVQALRFEKVYLHKCKEPVSVVLLLGDKKERIILVSTDATLATSEIVSLYRSRCLIEFGIRDTKQFAGLGEYQVRRLESIEKHLTLSQTAYSVGKIAFVLCESLRASNGALFYLDRRIKPPVFSIMKLVEDLRLDLMKYIFYVSPRKNCILDEIFPDIADIDKTAA